MPCAAAAAAAAAARYACCRGCASCCLHHCATLLRPHQTQPALPCPFGQMCVYFRRRKIIRRARRDRRAQRAEAKLAQQEQQAQQFMTAGDDGKPGGAAPVAGGLGWRGRVQELWQEFTGGRPRRSAALATLMLCCGMPPVTSVAAAACSTPHGHPECSRPGAQVVHDADGGGSCRRLGLGPSREHHRHERPGAGQGLPQAGSGGLAVLARLLSIPVPVCATTVSRAL